MNVMFCWGGGGGKEILYHMKQRQSLFVMIICIYTLPIREE